MNCIKGVREGVQDCEGLAESAHAAITLEDDNLESSRITTDDMQVDKDITVELLINPGFKPARKRSEQLTATQPAQQLYPSCTQAAAACLKFSSSSSLLMHFTPNLSTICQHEHTPDSGAAPPCIQHSVPRPPSHQNSQAPPRAPLPQGHLAPPGYKITTMYCV